MKIEIQAVDPRRWSRLTTGVFIVGAVAAALMLFDRDQPTALPPPVARAVERHALATAVDTAEISRFKRAADSAQAAEGRAIAKAHAGDALAKRQVYEAPSVQALTLSLISAEKDTALELAQLQAASLDSALARSEARAERADSVLGEVITVAESRTPPCRIAWLLPCPSRKAVMIGTAAVTALAVSGRIRIWSIGK